MKEKKSILSWLRRRKIINIRHEENFELRNSFRFSNANLVVIVFSLLVLVFILGALFAKYAERYISDEYREELKTRKSIIRLNVQLDSLHYEVSKRDLMILNIQKVINGDTNLYDFDSSYTLTSNNIDSAGMHSDPMLSDKMLEDDPSLLGGGTNSVKVMHSMSELNMIAPVEGIVTSEYEPAIGHYGVDIVAEKNEPIKATLDGIVIFSGWTYDAGYVIAIQHKEELLSIYKHNSDILKKVGNFVSAGETIAIIGNTGELTNGPHLHFEIWQSGRPLNPTEFLNL